MEKIINWLRYVEQFASDLYRLAAEIYGDDEGFSSFLAEMAQDESEHHKLMGTAADYLMEMNWRPASAIAFDPEIKDEVETTLRHAQERLIERTLTRQELVRCIIKMERSELNDIFLYAINTFQEDAKIIQHAAAAIQAHETRVETFIENLPLELKPPKDIAQLPRIWRAKVLIVEDDPAVRELFIRVIGKLADVETAANGKEGLKKTKQTFFNVVLSDIDMPVMNGLEFYQLAVEADPSTAHHFLFCSGNITPEIEAFREKYSLRVLKKPLKIAELREAIQDVMDKTL
jgi:CheY-like chemotaxis protein